MRRLAIMVGVATAAWWAVFILVEPPHYQEENWVLFIGFPICFGIGFVLIWAIGWLIAAFHKDH
jgi:hypothetical protein